MTLEEFYNNAWLRKAGEKEKLITTQTTRSISKMYKNNWCEEFEKYMRNRLVMGEIRYGGMTSAKYNYYEYMIKKLNLYKNTNNKEYLVDVANLAMLCFINDDGYFESENKSRFDYGQPKID